MPLGTALKVRNGQPHIWQVLVCAYLVRRVINLSFLTVSLCYPVIKHTFFLADFSPPKKFRKDNPPLFSPEKISL